MCSFFFFFGQMNGENVIYFLVCQNLIIRILIISLYALWDGKNWNSLLQIFKKFNLIYCYVKFKSGGIKTKNARELS